MADFSAHLAGGVISGTFFSLAGLFTQNLNFVQAAAVFVIGTIAGLLPDLDSDTGKPLAFLFQMLSVLIPSVIYTNLIIQEKNSAEFVVCFFSLTYIYVNYVLQPIVKKITVHRGMLHSIIFAMLAGGLAYLFFLKSGKAVGCLAGMAVFFGCCIHLLQDELHSIRLKIGIFPSLKKSSGSTLKLTSSSYMETLLIYILFIFVLVMIFSDVSIYL